MDPSSNKSELGQTVGQVCSKSSACKPTAAYPAFGHYGLVNAVNQDPALLLNHPTQPQYHYLFDCGDLTRLSMAAILRIRRLFLTHAHIDHIIGFDQILRAQLFALTPLTVYGPPGTIRQIGHRLQGYYWNLTGSSVYQVEVYELHDGYVQHKTYHCNRQFRASRLKRLETSKLELDEGGSIRWFPVFHGLPCIGYTYTAPSRWSANREALEREGLKPGPWLQSIKEALHTGANGDILATYHDGSPPISRPVSEWAKRLFEKRPGAVLAYVTDTLLDEPSRESISSKILTADLLVCESTYSQESALKAPANMHATAAQAATLATQAKVGQLNLTHLSRRYNPCSSNHLSEARAIFPNTDFAPQFTRTSS